MRDDLSSFKNSLTQSVTFEAAARATLLVLVKRFEEQLAASKLAGKGRILRAMVHLRPGDAYLRVLALDRGDPGASYAASATAFRWVREYGASIVMDVHLGVVERNKGETLEVIHETEAPAWGNAESRATLLGRHATHLLVLPLRAPHASPDRLKPQSTDPHSDVVGMITLEADCRTAIGAPFVWQGGLVFAEQVANLAAPLLFSLPAEPGPPAKDPYLPVVGATMQSLVDMLRVFAQQEETLLISGPTGAGKSRLARFCHACSMRANEAFETLDLMTVPEELQMAELFGWRKGAFTGAVRDSHGCLGRAEGGTLFIDEIDKLSLKAQAGLLRVLEERTYRSLGDGAGERTANVRFIVGTNANLPALVRSGLFREDLFFRIHVLPVRVPSLAERRDEIVAWAEHLLERRHRETNRPGKATLSVEAQRLLLAQSWPGNLRQLDNILRRAYALFRLDAGATSAPVELAGHHVERALAYESPSKPEPSFIEHLHAAAASFVRLAEERRGSTPVDMRWTEALRGFVYGTAALKLGSVDEAFRLFGKETLVQHRNHTKTLKKELERVEELYAALGAGPSPFATLSDDPKEDP